MSLKIDQSPAAIADVLKIADYLAEEGGLNTSDKFLRAVNQTVRQLADMPGMGASASYENPQLARMKRFPVSGFTKYLVFYETTETGIRVLRVIHGSQDIEKIFTNAD